MAETPPHTPEPIVITESESIIHDKVTEQNSLKETVTLSEIETQAENTRSFLKVVTFQDMGMSDKETTGSFLTQLDAMSSDLSPFRVTPIKNRTGYLKRKSIHKPFFNHEENAIIIDEDTNIIHPKSRRFFEPISDPPQGKMKSKSNFDIYEMILFIFFLIAVILSESLSLVSTNATYIYGGIISDLILSFMAYERCVKMSKKLKLLQINDVESFNEVFQHERFTLLCLR